MDESLDQNEVDALLSAINEGEVETQAGAAVAEPAAATAQIFTSGERNTGQLEIRRHDFNHPERVSKDQIRALSQLCEGFSRNFGASLSGFLRTIAEVQLANVEQLAYSQFISRLANPTSFNLIRCAPLEGLICLEINPEIIYPIIDRLLGGNNEQVFVPKRPLTQIEQRLVRKITDRAMEAYSEAWSSIMPLQCTLQGVETNPQLVQIVPPNEVVVSVSFEIRVADQIGTMNLCIPFNVIEPVIEQLSAQGWYQGGVSDGHLRGLLTKAVSRVPVRTSAILAETTITVGDLIDMAPGDVITTEKPSTAPVVLSVEGRKKFLAMLGQHKNKRALQIKRSVTPDDRV